MPVTLDAFGKMAAALPDVEEGARHGHRTWFVGKKGFAWERPFSKADIKRFGDDPVPDGDIAAVITADLHAKEALLAADLPGFFTIEHFNGYTGVLIQLKKARTKDVREAIEDAYDAATRTSSGSR